MQSFKRRVFAFAIILLMCVTTIPLMTNTASAADIGYTSVGGSWTSIQDTICGSPITLTNWTSVTSISAYLDISLGPGDGAYMKAAIYNVGMALTVEEQTTESYYFETVSTSWETFTFSSPVVLSADTYYIAVWGENIGTVNIAYDAGSGMSHSETYGATFPSIALIPSPFDSNTYSIYASVTYDTTAPSSSVNTITPYWKTSSTTITAAASDVESGVKNVSLYYRYAPDNSTWGAWTNFGVDGSSPWSWTFTFPSGFGYYQFYSRGYDNSGNHEGAPGGYDARCGYTTNPVPSNPSPTNGTQIPFARWKNANNFSIDVSDGSTNLSIQWQNDAGGGGVYWVSASAGTFSVPSSTIGTAFSQNKTYKWWVNITTPSGTKRYWYTYSTMKAVNTKAATSVTASSAVLWMNATYGIGIGFWIGDQWPVNASNFDSNITINTNYGNGRDFDINNDSWVTNQDVSNITLHVPYNWYHDLNNDGVVNSLDISYWVGHATSLANNFWNLYNRNYTVSTLHSTYHYSYRAWVNGSFYTGLPMNLFTLPSAPTSVENPYRVDNYFTFTWIPPTTNDPNNLTTIVRYSTTGCPTNETDGTLLTETSSDNYSVALPVSASGHYYVAFIANFSGNYSAPVCLTLDATGGVYNFNLLMEKPDYPYVDLNDVGILNTGKHEFTVHYKDGSQETNYYQIGYWKNEGNFSAWYNNTFVPQLNASLHALNIEGGSYIKRVSWTGRTDGFWPFQTYWWDFTVKLHMDSGVVFVVDMEQDQWPYLSLDTYADSGLGDHTFTMSCLQAQDEYGIRFTVDVLGPVYKITHSYLNSHTYKSWSAPDSYYFDDYSALNTLWTNFLADSSTSCANFDTWWAGWQANFSNGLIALGFDLPTWPTVPPGLCGVWNYTTGWSYLESDLTDNDTTDGRWQVNASKDIDWVEFKWSEADDFFNITWNATDYCDRKTVVTGHDVFMYIRNDLHYIPYITDAFKGGGLAQYHIKFSNIYQPGAYANIYIKTGTVVTKRIIHSEYLDATYTIHPMLLVHNTYYLEVVKADGTVVDCGSFIAGTDDEIVVSAQGVQANTLIYNYCDITSQWTGGGFQVNFHDNTGIAQIWFFVYSSNGTELYNTTFTGQTHTFTFAGPTNVSYYYKIDVSNIIGFLSTGKVPMQYSPAVPHVTGSYINTLFNLMLGPSPLTMGGATVDWAYIIVLILALIGLLAFVKGKYVGLIVEGFIFIASAAVMNDIGASIGLGAAGMFLIILGLLAALGSKKETKEEQQ